MSGDSCLDFSYLPWYIYPLLDIRNNIPHITITRNSIEEIFGIILWISIPADLRSKVYVWWNIWRAHFLMFIKLVCIANLLHHLLLYMDVHHEIVKMDNAILIISLTCSQPIISCFSKLRCIIRKSNPHIAIGYIWIHPKVSHNLSDYWCICISITIKTIYGSDNNYYYSLVNIKLLYSLESYRFLSIFVKVNIFGVGALHIMAIKGYHHQYNPKIIPWYHWCICHKRWRINFMSIYNKPDFSHKPTI